jgi:hypothetical protein
MDIKVPPAAESKRFLEEKFSHAYKVWIIIKVVSP